jgi:UDP-glucuronate 4-epimerase
MDRADHAALASVRFDGWTARSLPFAAVTGTPAERVLVTGAQGCIGAWTVRLLVAAGGAVVAFDLARDMRRLRLLMTPDELAAVTFAEGDITDLAALERVIDDHAVTRIIHLAALQVPFARADPPRGALVNVVGTVNVLEAAARRRDRVHGVVQAGSIGMFDASDADASGRLRADADAHPRTHYGVHKLAAEGAARAYWLDRGLPSIALRPLSVYGLGRDQGLTSGPTRAILAAVAGRPFRIGFGGRTLFNYAPDVARAFVAASRVAVEGAPAINLPGSEASIDEFVAAIERAVPGAAGLVTHDPDPLPFPSDIDTSGVEVLGDLPVTPLPEAVAATAALFRERLTRGELVPEEHGLEPPTSGSA